MVEPQRCRALGFLRAPPAAYLTLFPFCSHPCRAKVPLSQQDGAPHLLVTASPVPCQMPHTPLLSSHPGPAVCRWEFLKPLLVAASELPKLPFGTPGICLCDWLPTQIHKTPTAGSLGLSRKDPDLLRDQTTLLGFSLLLMWCTDRSQMNRCAGGL